MLGNAQPVLSRTVDFQISSLEYQISDLLSGHSVCLNGVVVKILILIMHIASRTSLDF